MSSRAKFSRVIFVAMVCTFLLAAASLLRLWVDESAVRPLPMARGVTLSGVYYTDKDPTPSPIPADGDLALSRTHHKITFIGHFDRDVPANETLALRLDNLHLTIYLNGERLVEYGEPYATLPYVRSQGNGWRYLTSPGITTEDEVRFEAENLYLNHPSETFEMLLQSIGVGNTAVGISGMLRAELFRAALSLFILLMGILELGYACALARIKEDANPYFALGGLSVSASIWFLIQFDTLELFIPYPVFNNAIQSLSLGLGFCYVLLYVGTQLTAWRQSCMRVSALVGMLFLTGTICSQHLGLGDYYDYVPILYLLLLAVMVEVLLLLCLEYRTRRETVRRARLIPMFLIFTGALADVVASYLGVMPFVIFEICFCLFNLYQLYAVWISVNAVARDRAKMRTLRDDHERQQRLLEYQTLLSRATKGLYESIYELDITHDRAGDTATRKYFESLGVPPDTSYDEALQQIARTQIHPDYRQGYIDMFHTKAVLEQYGRGVDALQYDFLISRDGQRYYWMRIDARIFYWKHDHSVRMITYRQNVDAEKRQELALINRAEMDPLTGLLNREALQARAESFLEDETAEGDCYCAILDIDHFKRVNDTFGHVAGDMALREFARILKAKFRPGDLLGRMGGDEFLVFLRTTDASVVRARVASFLDTLASSHVEFEGKELPLTASVGIAVGSAGSGDFATLYRRSDAALYRAKADGRNRYALDAGEEGQA